MKIRKFLKMKSLLIIAFLLLFNSCAKDEDEKNLQPTIEIITPLMCDVLYFDEEYTYKFKLTDPNGNGLGNFSMDIHHNFNHHVHGDHLPCEMDPKKDQVNPFEKVWVVPLPDDEIEYILEMKITVPSEVEGKEGKIHDYGDYHFHIYTTNIDGYQAFTALEFKLLHED